MLETWVIDLLNNIKEADTKGECFDLHLELETVKDITEQYDATTWIEIY